MLSFARWFFAAVVIAHFVSVYLFAVNVPYWDEWEALKPGALGPEIPWDWIFGFHMENRHATSKFLTWLFYKYDGWNLRHQIFLNAFIYTGAVGIFYLAFRRLLKGQLQWQLMLILSVFFSPQMYENSLWGWQSNYILTFFFLALMLWQLADLNSSSAPVVIFIACLAATYSTAFGAIVAIFGLFGTVIFLILQKKMSLAWLLSLTFSFVGIALWFVGRPSSTPTDSVNISELMVHGLSLFSLIIGNHTELFFWIGLLPIVALLWVTLLYFRLSYRQQQHIPIWFYLTGCILILPVVSLSRHGIGIQQAFTSRYYMYAFLLIPFFCFSWMIFNPSNERNKKISTWLSCLVFLGYVNDWSYSKYSSTQEERLDQLKCLKNSWPSSEENLFCKSSYPENIKVQMTRAQELNISFFKEILSEK